MTLLTQKVYVNYIPLDSAVGDYEPRVSMEDESEMNMYEEEILSRLEGNEKKAIEMIFQGYNFLEISKELGLKESQIYKIKRDLAHKFNYLHNTNTPARISSVVKLYVIGKLKNMARRMHTIWYADKVLREYDRPTQKMIEDYIEDVLLSLGSGRVVYRTPGRLRQLYHDDCQLPLFD